MGLYQLKTEQLIPADIEAVWDFISSPRNLSKITPPSMGFTITNEPIADTMYAGMIICYKVSPLWGVRMDWVTEITHVVERRYFVDEQRLGPYKIWHHEHGVESVPEGVRMRDVVSYLPPFGVLGRAANRLFIKKRLGEIFRYRFQAIEREFGALSPLGGRLV